MVDLSQVSPDPASGDTVADDNVHISQKDIASFYEQIRHKFPDKQFPADATCEQMVEIVRAFHDGAEMARPQPD